MMRFKHLELQRSDRGYEFTRLIAETLPGPAVVQVLATTEDGVLLVRQWRARTDFPSIELPGGRLEAEDRGDVLAAAKRELQEETGFRLERPRRIGEIAVAAPVSDCLAVVVAGDATPLAATTRDDAEEILDVLCIDMATIWAATKDPNVLQGWISPLVVVAIALTRSNRDIQ